MLIYFGFSHCPDICPDELEKMALVVDNLGITLQFMFLTILLIVIIFFNFLEKNEMNTGIQGIFITVDPERDTPKVVEKYIKEFSPKFIGLSGTSDQIQQVCKKYRVYYSPGKKDVDNDYIVSFVKIQVLILLIISNYYLLHYNCYSVHICRWIIQSLCIWLILRVNLLIILDRTKLLMKL